MPITQRNSGTTPAVGIAPFYLASNSTTPTWQTEPGVYQLFLDCMDVGAGDLFTIQIWEKVIATDVAEQVMIDNISGPLDAAHYATPALALIHGWDYSVQKITGTDRAFTYSIRKLG